MRRKVIARVGNSKGKERQNKGEEEKRERDLRR